MSPLRVAGRHLIAVIGMLAAAIGPAATVSASFQRITSFLEAHLPP